MKQNNYKLRMINYERYKAHIFDLDGTLLDSMWVWHTVDQAFFAVRGLALPEDYAEEIQSMTFRETAEYTIRRFALPETPEEIMAEWNALSFAQYRDNVRLKPGAKEYLARLRTNGVALGVASNLTTHVIQAALTSNGILDWFQALTSADEVARGKGYPDIYLLAAKKLGALPAQCVVYDDIARAMLGIKAAGMAACAVRERSLAQDWDEMRRLADYRIESFEELIV